MLAEEDKNEGIEVSSRLWTLLLIGIGLVFAGIVVILVAAIALGSVGSVGGVIFIGPIPIVFGAGPDAVWLIVISIILSVISIVLFTVLGRRAKRE